LNPYLLPKVGFSGNSAWIETTAPGGAPVRESVHSDTIAQRLLEVMTGNGALAPAWQVQSQLVQHQTLVASGASAADINATLGAGAGGHAAAGNQAYAIQGLASESADFKTQSFGALVLKVHASATVQSSVAALDQHLQDSQVQTSQIYKNTDADAYLEKTQWVSATDAQGNAQGILVLDFNGNGAIETQDLLNLGGNAGQGGNQTDEAARATANTANQHNNAQWLDANSDGVLNASDPAFAAIKLWVMQAGEGQALAAQVQSININTGEVTYSDGSSAAIAATTLQSDTSGVKLTQLMQVDADGKLVALDAGTFVEHEGYEGQVQVSDDAGTRWGKVSKQTYEQDAKRTGDWEGTAEQDAHRHGGGNVAGTPTETSVTSVTGMGPVRGINQVTYATLQEGDARVVSDALTQAAPRQPNAQTVINAGDIRIKSAAAPASATPPRPPSPTLAFVPMGGASAQNEVRLMTAQMMESAQTSPFGLGGAGGMGLGVLAGVGLGMVQTTAFAVAPATQFTYAETQSAAAHGLVPETTMEVVRATVTEATPRPGSGASTADVLDNNTATTIVFRQVNLGTLRSVSSANSPVGTARDTQEAPQLRVMLSPGSTDSTGSNRGSTDTSATQDTPSGNTHSNSSGSAGVTTSVTNSAPTSSVTAAPVMLAPTVRGEVLQGSEDVAYRLDASVLLANDSSFMSGLSITGVGLASHGRVSLVNGVIIFVPDANFHGTASFEYTVSDAYGLSSTSTAVLETVTVNDAPVALGEQTQGEEDIGLIFTQADLLANDSDVDTATDGQTLRISSVGDALHGTVWLDAGGAVRFVPDANYHGPAQFTYWVDDGAGAQTAATVQLTVAAVNDAPRTRDEQAQGVEDTGLLFSQADLLANDTDVDTATDGQVLRISSAGDALHGVVSIDANGDLRFMPDANYHGPAQFTYWVDDGNGGRAPATVNLTISGVNDVPVATDDLAQGYEDIGLIFTQIQLLANDIDPDVATDGQVLQITRVEQAQHGVVWMDANGDLRFVPDANYHGPAQFTYWMTDGESDPVSATVHLTVLAVNDLPVTLGETGSSDEDVTLVFDPATLLGNDSDVDTATDGQVLSISAVGNATHGTVALVAQNGAQRIEFTPEANFFGVASYEYTVSDGAGGNVQTTVMLNLAPVNDAPTAVNDSLQGMDEDAALHISLASLLGNDTDADAHNSQWGGTDDTFALHAVGNATHGTVAIVAGEVVFTPDANYNGPASFAYQVSDGSGALSQAVATFDIASVEDAPIAVAETIAANEDETLLINPAALLANDIDPDVATNGEVLSITGVNHAMHGTVSTHADGQIEFVPDADFFGAASFDYTMTDGHGGMSSTTTVIQVANVDDAPIATGETINSFEDQVLNLRAALVANEVDIDNTHAELGISRVQVNSGGSAYVTGNGDLIFTPDANYSGTASFTYWVRDPAGLESNPVTATLQIAEVNDAPVAQGEYLTGASEDAAFHISRAQLLANDYDVDGPNSALHLSSIGNATNGTVAQDANGDMVFTPNANFNGTASFSYRVTDDQGAQSDAVQVVIPVAAVNDVPVVVDDQFQTLRNTDMTIAFNQLIGNDTDADGDALTVGGVRNASNGAVSIANGDVHFSANNNFVGQASFEYQADDGHGAQAWATAFVNVNAPVNLYPTISLSADQTHD
ncbi:MAG: cadherin-like domain-containing protein, partial [Rhodoferax sp.]